MTARRVGTLAVLLLSITVYLLLAVGWVVVSGSELPTGEQLALAAAAGIGVGVGLAAFYRGLAVGTMSIVAPISATGVLVPIVAGIAGGESPSLVRTLGMAAAIVGIIFAVRAPRTDGASRVINVTQSVQCALLAALGFGVFNWLIAPASESGLPWAVLICRTVTLPVLIGVIVVAGVSLRPALRPRTFSALFVIGVLSFSAIVFYAQATQHGPLSVVAVAGSLYPAVTTLLARYQLSERLSRGQQAGIVTVLVGVVLMAAG